MRSHTALHIALMASLCAVACSATVTPEARSSIGPSSTSPADPAPARLPSLTLTASLDEPPVDWTQIAFLPAGDAQNEVGFRPCSDCVLPVPAALAVADNGSLWIADALKRRVAHFSSDGSFIGAIPVKQGPADLVFVGHHLYALLKVGGSAIVRIERGGVSKAVTVNNDGKPLHVQGLIGGQDELVTLIAGAGKLLGAYWAMTTVDPVTGQVTPAAGAEVSRHRFMDFAPLVRTRDADYGVLWSNEEHTSRQRTIRFQLLKNSKQLGTTVGDTYVRSSTSTGVITLVNLGGQGGLPAGRWYLEIPMNGAKLIFERVPEEGFIGDALRYLSVGDDGRVYWMQLGDNGLHVYRRPQV